MSKNIEREEGRRGKLREFSMNSKCRCILFSQHFDFFLSLPRMINDNIFFASWENQSVEFHKIDVWRQKKYKIKDTKWLFWSEITTLPEGFESKHWLFSDPQMRGTFKNTSNSCGDHLKNLKKKFRVTSTYQFLMATLKLLY